MKIIAKSLIAALIALGTLSTALINFGNAVAADKEYHYQSINVDISILDNSDMRISEVQTFNFTSGDFHYGFRWIPTDRLNYIDNVQVWEGDRQYPFNAAVEDWIIVRQETGESPGGDTYAYATWIKDGKFCFGWWFPETSHGSRVIDLRYTVHGGLRINTPDDQLYWKAVFSDRDTYVSTSKVVVHLPQSVPPEQLSIYTFGVPASSQIVDDNTIEFITASVPADEEFEIDIYFPHGLVSGTAAPWQFKLEKQEAYDRNVKPIINLSLTIFGLIVVPLIGAVWISRAFARRGPAPVVAETQSQYSPPDNLPPALVSLVTRNR
ncbi:MAG TPA: DUF2207 domain-containing protein, partial [Dehalococcoidia bacterium]